MKRYDRLSSSKSDLHLNSSANESSVDEIDLEALEDEIKSSKHNDLVENHILNSKLVTMESYSSTENIIPPSTPLSNVIEGSQISGISSGNLPTVSSDCNTVTTNSSTPPSTSQTFRSFIKTKTSSGISGMMRNSKDNAHHQSHRTNIDDDEEALQLCDSESTVSSLNQHGFLKTTTQQSTTDNQIKVSNNAQGIFLSNPCHSTQSTCNCMSLVSSTSPQTTITSMDSASSKNFLIYNKQLKHSLSNPIKSMYISGQLQDSSTSPTSHATSGLSNKSRSHIRIIPPLLKPNRFAKHSKGNLLFNVKSGHKSKSKQRLTEAPSNETLSNNPRSDQPIESLKFDRMIVTQPEEDRRRRTIIIEKQNNSFGFTLQTYGIKHCREGEVELITYVDEVAYGGPAFRGGMRPGDVILSINGRDVEKADHRTLVNVISACEKTMRLVVLFEDCVRKIELNIKYLKLKKVLQQKLAQLEIMNQRENQLLLNAATRVRMDTCVVKSTKENNNNECALSSINSTENTHGQLKMYKCKSLDVSLDDLNYKIAPKHYFPLESNDCGEWPATSKSNTDDSKEYSTTFPRFKSSSNYGSNSLIESDDDDDEFNGHADDDDDEDIERRTLHKGRRKISVGASPIDQDDHEIGVKTSDNNSSSRSKSLPHSVANSLDCLTNEAYEDDEDLIVGNRLENRTNSIGPKIDWANENKRSIVTTTVTTIKSGNSGTSDRDFITKL